MSIPKYIVIPEESVDESSNFMPLTPLSELWHKDDDYPNCELCNKKFTLVNRRHHCRNCGKIICFDCLMYQHLIRTQFPAPPIVCKLCKFCVFSIGGKESDNCKNYMREANLVDEKQFIADDFSINGKQIHVGDTLNIKNIARSRSMYYPYDVIYKAKVDSLDGLHGSNGKINMTLTETNDDKYGYDQVGEKVYLQNDNHNAYHEGNRKIPSGIIIYHQVNQTFVDLTGEDVSGPIPSGYVYVTPPAQGGGYKYRKNKSKRKNKRSVKRRMSNKRSNIRRKNKKVTKRLRKSRRRRARR